MVDRWQRGPDKRTGETRSITLPDFAADLLRRYIAERGPDLGDPVFRSASGSFRSPNNFRRRWRDAVAGTGFEWVTPHTFRRTVATLLGSDRSTDDAATWERAVNLEVASQLVDRGTNEVRPQMFRVVSLMTEADNTDFQSGYGAASCWAGRHDKAPEVNFTPPGLDEMQAELDRLKTWYRRIKGYKNAKKN
jgi:hypothetical protein